MEDEGETVDGKMNWIWRKGVSVGKKVLAASLVMAFASFLVPPLIVASAIAMISSLPYCFFLAGYVCTEKLMRKLLPATAFGGGGDKMVLLLDKIGQCDFYDDGIATMSAPIVVQTEEDDRTHLRVANNIVFDVYQSPEDMKKESKRLLEIIRDEGPANQSFDSGESEKALEREDKELIYPSDAKQEKKVEDLSRKKKVLETTHEGELKSTTAEASREKGMEKSSDEMKVLYREEQIWAKMETLRKVVGYSVARSTTYSEELKALYMFTGVALQPEEEENQDIEQVSERLCFLMSVIGTK